MPVLFGLRESTPGDADFRRDPQREVGAGGGDLCVGDRQCGMNVISLDYPKPDGTTTYTDLVKFFGDQGAYFDIGSETQQSVSDSRSQNLA
jgi:hypothetical protein